MTASPGTPDPACIFCKIIAGSAPCHKVYEDDWTLAFLDINPLADFHTLLIPKRHYVRMEDTDDESAAALGVSLKKISRVVTALSGEQDFNILLANGKDAGQEVWHAHYHFVPRGGRQDGLGYRWKVGRLPPQPAIDTFLDKARALLQRTESERK